MWWSLLLRDQLKLGYGQHIWITGTPFGEEYIGHFPNEADISISWGATVIEIEQQVQVLERRQFVVSPYVLVMSLLRDHIITTIFWI